MNANQYSLHAREGCRLVNSTAFPYTGSSLFEDCNYVFNVTGNRGCGIAEPSRNSLGAAFAQSGGGLYVMYWSSTGIRFWLFGVRTLLYV